MIKEVIESWEKHKPEIREVFSKGHPEDYKAIVSTVIKAIGEDCEIDPERIHQIDDGDYQGTLLFVIAAIGYQPREYYYCRIEYGSCSGCDTLQSICDYSGDAPTQQQIDDYMTLALGVVQRLKKMDD